MKKASKVIKKISTIWLVTLIIYIAYIILINNPVIIYNCDKDIANSIISKEDIVDYAKNTSNRSFFKIVKVRVSNPNLLYKTIDLEMISTFPIMPLTIGYSQNDAPDFHYRTSFN